MMKNMVIKIRKYGKNVPKSFERPEIVSLSARPKAFEDITVKLPIVEQRRIFIITFLCPYLGTMYTARNIDKIIMKITYVMKAAPCSFSINTARFSTSVSFGEWMTIIVDPRIHSTQPIFPSKLSFSLRNFDANTAAIIMLSAPKGVTNAAGIKIRR